MTNSGVDDKSDYNNDVDDNIDLENGISMQGKPIPNPNPNRGC